MREDFSTYRRGAAGKPKRSAPTAQDLDRLESLLKAEQVSDVDRVTRGRELRRVAGVLAVTAVVLGLGQSLNEAIAGPTCRAQLITAEADLTTFAIHALSAARALPPVPWRERRQVPGPTASPEIVAELERAVAAGTTAYGQFLGTDPAQQPGLARTSTAWDALPSGSGPRAWSGPFTVLAGEVSRAASSTDSTCDRVSTYQRQGAHMAASAANTAAVRLDSRR